MQLRTNVLVRFRVFRLWQNRIPWISIPLTEDWKTSLSHLNCFSGGITAFKNFLFGRFLKREWYGTFLISLQTRLGRVMEEVLLNIYFYSTFHRLLGRYCSCPSFSTAAQLTTGTWCINVNKSFSTTTRPTPPACTSIKRPQSTTEPKSTSSLHSPWRNLDGPAALSDGPGGTDSSFKEVGRITLPGSSARILDACLTGNPERRKDPVLHPKAPYTIRIPYFGILQALQPLQFCRY